jgi:hypothetical protein
MHSPTNKRKLGLWFLIGLPVLYLVIDNFYYWGVAYDRARLVHFACGVLPFAKLASPVVSQDLLDAVTTQCLAQPNDRILSAILYMLKLSLAFVAAPLLCIVNVLFDRDAYSDRRAKDMNFYRSNTFTSGAKKAFPTIVCVGGACVIFMIYLSLFEDPQQFVTNIFRKITEDWTTVFLFFVFYAGLMEMISLATYVMSRPKNRRSD